MLLILVRHAQAVVVGEAGATTDYERTLTPHGRRQADELAIHLTNLGIRLDVLMTSPYHRTVETAERLRGLLTNPEEILLSPEFSSGSGEIMEMAEAIAATGEETVLAVGHMPEIAELATWLAGKPIGAFEPAQAVAIRFDHGLIPEEGQFEWLFVPQVDR